MCYVPSTDEDNEIVCVVEERIVSSLVVAGKWVVLLEGITTFRDGQMRWDEISCSFGKFYCPKCVAAFYWVNFLIFLRAHMVNKRVLHVHIHGHHQFCFGFSKSKVNSALIIFFILNFKSPIKKHNYNGMNEYSKV